MAESEIAKATLGDGTEFVLFRHDEEWIVRADGRTLMSSRMHDSEVALADEAIDRVDEVRAVLVGGLGLGFTLRAVLDGIKANATVTVLEIVPELVDWNRTHLGALTGFPIQDPRCTVVVGDVVEHLQSVSEAYDVILLDVDNGPAALARAKNQRLYGERGIRLCRRALRSGGVLAVWSAEMNERYRRKLEAAGLRVDVMRVPAREGSPARHVLFLADVP